jgi:hypothetical protein
MSRGKPSPRPPAPPAGPPDDEAALLAPQPLPLDADPPEGRRDPPAMRALVQAALRRLNLPSQHLVQEELAAAWRRAASPEMLPLARPGKWERGVIYLYVPNSARLFEFQRAHLRAAEAALRQALGADRVRQVRLLLDPDAAVPAP